MNRKVLSVALVTILSALSSCNSSNSSAGRAASPGQASGPAWKFTFKSTCAEGVDATQCVGLYGFAVAADGTYSVGPAPAGQMNNGKLTAEEFSTFSDAVTQAAALPSTDSNVTETCVESEAINTMDTITLVHLTKTAVVAHQMGSQFCYKGTHLEASKALYAAMTTLATKYYALPFPDACLDAAAKLTGMYASVQGCKVDADCSYITESYETIAPGALQFVVTNNCSIVSPMVAGNSAAVTAAQVSLQQALSNVQSVCGQRMIDYNCTQQTGFQSTSAAPVCASDHLCHANPGVSSL